MVLQTHMSEWKYFTELSLQEKEREKYNGQRGGVLTVLERSIMLIATMQLPSLLLNDALHTDESSSQCARHPIQLSTNKN